MSKVKHARSRKPRPRDTMILYVRIHKSALARLRAVVAERGYPHSMASVSGEVFVKGLDAIGAPEVNALEAAS